MAIVEQFTSANPDRSVTSRGGRLFAIDEGKNGSRHKGLINDFTTDEPPHITRSAQDDAELVGLDIRHLTGRHLPDPQLSATPVTEHNRPRSRGAGNNLLGINGGIGKGEVGGIRHESF